MVLLRRPFLCFSGSVERCVWMKGRHSDTNVYYTGNECMTVNSGGRRRVVATAFFAYTAAKVAAQRLLSSDTAAW